MSGETTGNNGVLIDNDIQSSFIKQVLMDDFFASQWVDWLNEFSAGSSTFRIPSISEGVTDDYTEESAIKFRPLDKGEFTMVIDKHKTSGHYITDIAQEDLLYASQLVAAIAPAESRAIAKTLERDILALQQGQTAANTNLINGNKHRFVATGSSNVMAPTDFARAKLSLKTANASDQNLIAIVDPSVAFTLETSTNLVNVSNNRMWEGVIADGMTNGMRFVKNVYGFDVWTSNYVDTIGTETLETVTADGFAANLFFSADGENGPFKGAVARQPRFLSWRDEDREITKYNTSMRYGLSLYRPESLVVIPSNKSV
ncbi:MAG: hypothetical protein JKY50_00090 [Oleispira sp.]|nr:hypothetical protein [Oleispira sp.]